MYKIFTANTKTEKILQRYISIKQNIKNKLPKSFMRYKSIFHIDIPFSAACHCGEYNDKIMCHSERNEESDLDSSPYRLRITEIMLF